MRDAGNEVKTTLGRFGFEQSISLRNSVMETKVPALIFSTMSKTIECNHVKLYVVIKLYCIYRCFNT